MRGEYILPLAVAGIGIAYYFLTDRLRPKHTYIGERKHVRIRGVQDSIKHKNFNVPYHIKKVY